MEKESNKMTAVEWVLQYLNNVKPNEFCSIEKIKELLEQAKEMEKQQMIDFADNYVDNCVLPNENMAIPTIMDVPNYYNEQYGGKDGE
jgi:c-di-AMP phosphodiesterase-like protein